MKIEIVTDAFVAGATRHLCSGFRGRPFEVSIEEYKGERYAVGPDGRSLYVMRWPTRALVEELIGVGALT